MSVTYLIAGPIAGRNQNNPCGQINAINEVMQKFSSENSLSISTTSSIDAVLVTQLDKNIRFILSDDPGEDYRKEFPWRSRRVWNLTRMYTSTVKGLESLESKWTIKTRVELLPKSEDVNEHIERILYVIHELEKRGRGSIAILEEDYWGPTRPRKGVLSWLPDTFQIMKTQDMKKLWSEAQQKARIYMETEVWHEKNALSSEQILGATYYRNFVNRDFCQPKKRFDFTLSSFKDSRKAEKDLLLLIPYDTLLLQESKFTTRNTVNSALFSEKIEIRRSDLGLLVNFLIYRALNQKFPRYFAIAVTMRVKLGHLLSLEKKSPK